jgi:hypothetical protein
MHGSKSFHLFHRKQRGTGFGDFDVVGLIAAGMTPILGEAIEVWECRN